MKIYQIKAGYKVGYDTYDGGVFIAENEEQAITLWKEKTGETRPIETHEIGLAKATEPGVVLLSFNAG